jgi:hypothetical protein
MSGHRLAFTALLAGFVGSFVVWTAAYIAGMFMPALAAELVMIVVLVAGESLHRTAHSRRSARMYRRGSL